MKGFLHKAKDHVQSSLQKDKSRGSAPAVPSKPKAFQQGAPLLDVPSVILEPTPQDVLRYRYHHGANLGSIYVLEKWLHGSMFPPNAAPGQSSELEALKLWVNQIGMDAARTRFEMHWASAVTDDDLKWLSGPAKCTTIRLPIGYFTLGFTQGTPFEPYTSIYANAWSSIENLIGRLHFNGIGVLLDLHALPGGANGGEHSGTNSGLADLWSSEANLTLALRCAGFLAEQIRRGLQGVVGIQLVNEANWNALNMYQWYDNCITAISAVDPSIPIIISDGWDLPRALDYVAKKNIAVPAYPTCPVIIDTHYYWAFTNEDKAKSPQTIIAEARTKLNVLDGKEGNVINKGAVQVIVGEYSCVMTEDSWRKAGSTSKEDLVKQFGQAQSQRWQSRAGGSYFWTYKMDWIPGGEWGFIAQTNAGAITPPPSLRLSPSEVASHLAAAESKRDTLMRVSVDAHVHYWDQSAPGKAFEHWRYENGWKVGFNDALAFLGMSAKKGWYASGQPGGGDKIGCLELWVLKRVRESGMRGGFVWEFEQGVRAGIRDFYEVAGV